MRKLTALIFVLLIILPAIALCQQTHPVLTPTQGNNGLWGYKNEVGQWAFEPQWEYVGIFRDGVAVVDWGSEVQLDGTQPSFKNKGCGILRDDGTWVLPQGDYELYDRHYYEDGFDMAAPEEEALIGGSENGFIEIWDLSGEEDLVGFYCIATDTLVMPQWLELQWGANDENLLIPVCDPEKYLIGYVDRYGQLVIPYQFESAGCFVDGCADVATATEGMIINMQGETIPIALRIISLKEVGKDGLQALLEAQIQIETNGAGPVHAVTFIKETPVTASLSQPLPDGVHTLLMQAPWGIDYEKYIREGRLAAQVNCGAWYYVDMALSEE